MQTKRKLYSLLANGKTKEVISEIILITENDTTMKNPIIQIAAQFTENERQSRLNIVDSNQIKIERNRINSVLFSLIDDLEIEVGNDSIQPFKEKKLGIRTLLWFMLGLLAVFTFTFYLKFTNKPKSNPEKIKLDSIDIMSPPIFPAEKPSKNNTNHEIPHHAESKLKSKLPNLLFVSSDQQGYIEFFESRIRQILSSQNISSLQNNSKDYENRIDCSFNLNKDAMQSGIRDAFKYSLSLKINVYNKKQDICFSVFYSSSNSLIGYPEDSKDDIRIKIIEP